MSGSAAGGGRGIEIASIAPGYSIPERALGLTREELADEGVRRVEHVVAVARLDDPALPEHGEVLPDPACRGDVVGDHDVGAAVLGVHLLDQLAEQRRAHRVETRVRLVEHDDLGLEHERAREARALAHAARELVRQALAGVGQADLVEALVDDVGDLLLGHLRVLAQRERDVVVDVHRAEQRAVLEQDPERPAHLEQLGRPQLGDRAAMHDDVALVGEQQADQVLDEHALARARRAEHDADHALRDTDVEAVENTGLAEALVHVDALDRPEVAGRLLDVLHRALVVLVVGRLVEQRLGSGVVARLGVDRCVVVSPFSKARSLSRSSVRRLRRRRRGRGRSGGRRDRARSA